jgi:hypothetical protein
VDLHSAQVSHLLHALLSRFPSREDIQAAVRQLHGAPLHKRGLLLVRNKWVHTPSLIRMGIFNASVIIGFVVILMMLFAHTKTREPSLSQSLKTISSSCKPLQIVGANTFQSLITRK